MGTFLIADDSPGKRAFLKSVLKHAHWDGEIVEAANTEEAIEFVNGQRQIMCAFVDYEMPSQNGPAVIRALRGKNPAAHIALTTSSDSARYEKEAMDAGADAFVCTSWTQEAVIKRLLELLDEWNM